MIYESLKTKRPYPREEDFIRPGCGLDGHAYMAAKTDYEVDANSGYGVWKDEETGEVLFTERSEFIPASSFYCSGQGEWETTYTAHFPLKEGQTPEQAFKERERLDAEKQQLRNDHQSRAQKMSELSPEIYKRLQDRFETLKRKSEIELNKQFNQAVQLALKQENRRKQLEKRNQDPLWQATKNAAKILVAQNQPRQARLLVKNYLKQHVNG